MVLSGSALYAEFDVILALNLARLLLYRSRVRLRVCYEGPKRSLALPYRYPYHALN